VPEGPGRIQWPDGKTFAFTVFDDPDFQSLERGVPVYSLLEDLGFRTTRGVWPLASPVGDASYGITCDDPGAVPWLKHLQDAGFEMGLHNVSTHTSSRDRTIAGLDRFRELFGHDPVTMSQHYLCDESVYWGAGRVSGAHKVVYTACTLGKKINRFHGHTPGHQYFWGDLCRSRIRYMRNFVFQEINTLRVCPYMPYHDADRPYVNMWYSSTEGVNAAAFNRAISEANQDRLEEEGGACIMYTHFAYQFVQDGRLNARFRELMTRLARRNGWFVPVGTLLDYLRDRQSRHDIPRAERTRLERTWLAHKIRYGTA
jgi:hypothetical protein